MKSRAINLTVAVMVILIFFGCFPYKKAAQPLSKNLDETETDSLAPENRYYYFTESQLQRKTGNYDKAIQYLNKAIEADPESTYLRLELATLYLHIKENQRALSIVEKIIEKEPENLNALIMYGRLKQGLNQLDDAEAVYEKIIAIDAKQENIYLLLGGLYMQEKKLNRALKIYDQLIQNFPESYVGHFFIAKIFTEKNNTAGAEKEFKKTIEMKPDLEEPRYELINLYKTLGKEEKIIQLYLELLKRNPENIRAAMELGYYYHERGMTEYAEKIFKDLGARSIAQKEVIRTFVKRYLNPKEYDAAVIILEGMLKGAPDSSELHFITGVAFDRKKDKDKAIMYFKKVATDSSFYKEAVAHVAFLYQEQKKIEEAIHFLKDVIKKIPDDPEILLYLGSFYEDTGEFQKAENVLKQGLKIDSDNTRLRFRLGVVYDKWGRKKASIEEMKTVISLDEKDANALNYLGYTYAELGENLDEAERLIKAALKQKPDDGYITDSLGWVYYKKGLFDKALKYLEKAVSIVPDDPIILEHLGDIYLKISNKKKALQFYKRSLLKKEKDKDDLVKKIQGLSGQ